MQRAVLCQRYCERGVWGSDSTKGLCLVNTKGFWMEDTRGDEYLTDR